MKRNLIIILTFLITLINTIQAQDHIYSQFFNSPVYLNPALNGQFKGDIRVNMIYRNQWSSLVGKLAYMTASIDYNVPKFGGGFGLMFTHSNEGTAFLTKNNISGIYSYSVGSENLTISFGLQGGMSNRTIDYNKLVFSDQLDPGIGYTPGNSTSADIPQVDNKYYFDAGAGTNIILNNFMIGASFAHLNKPNESFTGNKAELPIRTIIHGSYMLPLSRYEDEDRNFLIPSVVFYKQAQAQSLSAGLQFKRRGVNAGVWYRTNGKNSPDAFVVSMIFDIFIHKDNQESMRLGFSHDSSMSKINYLNTSGTSEGSLGYQTTIASRRENSRFESTRKCYDFY